ncbi:hypothetical protein LCGC14_2094020 [marine sediment metagenome]|uniref:HTH cro/C1-type domain-containing protein n=1 Tax=marine sediment metagenome TaxID=412755 RepID=A0A0F9GPZ0_9ZZZZ
MGIPEWLEGMLKSGRYRSLRHMGRELHISPQDLSRWLNRQRTPSAPSCIRLAEATDTPVQDVLKMAHGGEALE